MLGEAKLSPAAISVVGLGSPLAVGEASSDLEAMASSAAEAGIDIWGSDSSSFCQVGAGGSMDTEGGGISADEPASGWVLPPVAVT